jgi:O-antigen/teichoic acid export membrane protein
MLIIILSLPLALQTDRIILSHVSSLRAVANYSVVVQIFAPVVALVTAASQPLWPMYARARRDGVPGPNLLKISLLFCAGATLICAVLVALADPLGHVIGGKSMRVGTLLPVAAALTVMIQALVAPLAMKLTDPAGLRVIATWNVLAIPVNLTLSILLAKSLGAPGPLVGTAITMLAVQGLPVSLYARRRTVWMRRRAEHAATWGTESWRPEGRRRRRAPGRHRLVTTR